MYVNVRIYKNKIKVNEIGNIILLGLELVCEVEEFFFFCVEIEFFMRCFRVGVWVGGVGWGGDGWWGFWGGFGEVVVV